MSMKLLYTDWYGQEVYYKKHKISLFGFKRKNTKFIHIFPNFTAQPAAVTYLQKPAWLMEDCMSFAFQTVDQLQ